MPPTSQLFLAVFTVATGLMLSSTAIVWAENPSFDCSKVEKGSIEERICTDRQLALLDNQLAEVYREARAKAGNEHPPVLRSEQRGWLKGRNACWKSADIRECVAENYRLRIAELQARYRLVGIVGEATYQCSDNPADVVVAIYFTTEPPTLIAERGDQVSLMYLQPSGSGASYRGPNESLWEHQGEARITWGYGAQPLSCRRVQPD